MAQRWAAEPTTPPDPLPAEDETCPDCGDPLAWEPARTALICQACDVVDVHPGIAERYAEQDAAAASRAVAVRVDPTAERLAALELAAAKNQVQDVCNRLAIEFDPEGLNGYPRELAAGFQGQFRELARMAAGASDMADLASVRDLAAQVGTNASQQRHMIDDAHRQRRQVEHWQAERQRQLTGPDPQEEEEEEDYWEEEEEEEEDYRRPASAHPYIALGELAAQAIRQRQATAARRQRNGECAFRHRFGQPPVAERLYGIGMIDPYMRGTGHLPELDPRGPQVRCCGRHRAAAEQHIRAQGYQHVVFTELP